MTRNDLEGKGQAGVTGSKTLSPRRAGEDPHRLAELINQAALEIEAAWLAIDGPKPAGDWAEYHPPDYYGRTRVVLLVRDPYWLHCYWEIAAPEREEIEAQCGREFRELPQVIRVHDLTTAAENPEGPSWYDVPITRTARNWYLETGRPGHRFQVQWGLDLPGRGFTPLAWSNVVTTPPDGISALVDEEWMAVEEDFRRLYRLTAGIDPGGGSIALVESLAQRLARRMGSGAVSSLGSGFRPPPEKRPFWLVVGTELIVYGATEPQAAVTIDGTPIDLRPDGTFSARYALPDGERALTISGVSTDGRERITITPRVHKETH